MFDIILQYFLTTPLQVAFTSYGNQFKYVFLIISRLVILNHTMLGDNADSSLVPSDRNTCQRIMR